MSKVYRGDAWYWAVADGIKCVARSASPHTPLYECVIPRRFIPEGMVKSGFSVDQITIMSDKVDRSWGEISEALVDEFINGHMPHASDWPKPISHHPRPEGETNDDYARRKHNEETPT